MGYMNLVRMTYAGIPVTLKLSLHYIVMSMSKFSLVWPSTAGAGDEQLTSYVITFHFRSVLFVA